jgi:transposase
VPDPNLPRDRAGRRAKRFLSPSEKYQAFVAVLCGDMTVAQCAEYWGVDRATIVKARETAKQGALDALAASRPGQRVNGVDPELVAARREIARLNEAVKEMAIKLTLLEGKGTWG